MCPFCNERISGLGLEYVSGEIGYAHAHCLAEQYRTLIVLLAAATERAEATGHALKAALDLAHDDCKRADSAEAELQRVYPLVHLWAHEARCLEQERDTALAALTAAQERQQAYLELLGRVAAGIQGYDGKTYRAAFDSDVVARLFEIDAALASREGGQT